MSSSFTQNLGLENPTPGDPATLNTWGTTENTGRTLLDSAVAGILTLGVGGAANVVLTTVLGAADQSRNAHFIFTGVLTGNIFVLWPSGRDRMFSIINSTTGAFSLSCGVDNGGGLPVGTSFAVPQGEVAMLVSDGTNVSTRITNGGISGGMPTGTVLSYAGAAAPTGYVFAAGQPISRATYSALFALIGTTYGVGDGLSTFNVPDMRGRVAAGLDNMGFGAAGRLTGSATGGVNANALNASGGEQSHQLTVAELAAHGHVVNDAGHVHQTSDGTFFATSPGALAIQGGSGSSIGGITNTSNNVSGISLQNSGSNTVHNTVQPTVVLNYIIKT